MRLGLLLIILLANPLVSCDNDGVSPNANTISFTISDNGTPLEDIVVTAHYLYDINTDLQQVKTNKEGRVRIGPLVEDYYLFRFTGSGKSQFFSYSHKFQIVDKLATDHAIDIAQFTGDITFIPNQNDEVTSTFFPSLEGLPYELRVEVPDQIGNLFTEEQRIIHQGTFSKKMVLENLVEGPYEIYSGTDLNNRLFTFNIEAGTSYTDVPGIFIDEFLAQVKWEYYKTIDLFSNSINISPIKSIDFKVDESVIVFDDDSELLVDTSSFTGGSSGQPIVVIWSLENYKNFDFGYLRFYGDRIEIPFYDINTSTEYHQIFVMYK